MVFTFSVLLRLIFVKGERKKEEVLMFAKRSLNHLYRFYSDSNHYQFGWNDWSQDHAVSNEGEK